MGTNKLSRREVLSLSAVLSAGLALSACASSTETEEAEQQVVEFRFTNAAKVSSLDVALSGTIETARISAQILEPLVIADINTGEPQAGLATDWSLSDDKKKVTFTLREGIEFQNGSPFDAAAVVTNVERWKKAAADDTSNAHVAYLQLFSGLGSEDGKTPLVTGCTAEGNTVVFTLSRPSSSFIRALTQPAYGIAAPNSLDSEGHFIDSPVGTGAYVLKSWDQTHAELERHEQYWAELPRITKITFYAEPNETKRYFRLMNDQTDVYDLVGLNHYVDLAKAGNLIQPRDPYAISFISINGENEIFKDVRVRQAVAFALSRGAIVRNLYPQGSQVANDFLPSLFMMKEDQTSTFYSQKTDQAKELLKAAGYKDEPVEFYYPTDVSLAALPQPEAIYAALAADLVKVGFNIVPKPIEWNEGYLDKITSPDAKRGLALNGFVGSYRDPNAFYSRVLATTSEVISSLSDAIVAAQDEPVEADAAPEEVQPSPSASSSSQAEPTVTYQQILDKIREADQLTSIEERREAYQKINLQVAQLMPAVPLAYPVSSVVLGKNTGYFPLSATGISNFSEVELR